MIQNVPQIIYAVIGSIIVAIISAWVTVRLSVRQFKSQKFWELKVEYYERIFDAIYAFDRKYRYKIHEETTAEELDDEEAQDLIDELNDASWELECIIFQGSFIINKKAIETLRQLNKRIKSEEPPLALFGLIKSRKRYEYFKTRRQDIQSAMEKLREIAKKDLKETK
ncbi:MAG: hypothetical protein WC602_04980 [archaeon]